MKTSRKTPEFVIDRLLNIANLRYYEGMLEPSAGEGDIISGVIPYFNSKKYNEMNGEQMYNMMDITAIELNKGKFDVLSEKLVGKKVYHCDFLNFKTEDKFFKIIAAPPFVNNSDLEHIRHMFSMLAYKGTIVSLTSPYWLTNNEPHQVEFRKWLEIDDKSHELYMLPDNCFIEKGKTVPTAIIKIKKEM